MKGLEGVVIHWRLGVSVPVLLEMSIVADLNELHHVADMPLEQNNRKV